MRISDWSSDVCSSDLTIGKTIEFANVSPEERNRFSLTDAEVEALAAQALIIEEHYGRPMDIEWGKDGVDGQLHILQARPETVQSRASVNVLRRYKLKGSNGTEIGRASCRESVCNDV